MRKCNATALLSVIIATTLVMPALPALADDEFPAFYSGYSLWIDEIPGQPGSGCGLSGWVSDDYDVPFAYPIEPVISDDMTVAYWEDADGQKWESQSLADPYPSGDYQWEGVVELGNNDPRDSISMEWVVTNDETNLNWMVPMYRRGGGLVFQNFIEPFSSERYRYDVTVSRSGYDLLVAAWSPEAAVPEPGSILALAGGLISLGWFALKQKYPY